MVSTLMDSLLRRPLLLQMPQTTACVFVTVVRILSFHINSDFVQLGVPDFLVYVITSYITLHSKGILNTLLSLMYLACTCDK